MEIKMPRTGLLSETKLKSLHLSSCNGGQGNIGLGAYDQGVGNSVIFILSVKNVFTSYSNRVPWKWCHENCDDDDDDDDIIRKRQNDQGIKHLKREYLISP